jgi:hypothetical protein
MRFTDLDTTSWKKLADSDLTSAKVRNAAIDHRVIGVADRIHRLGYDELERNGRL